MVRVSLATVIARRGFQDWVFWLFWVLATSIGFGLGSVVGVVLARQGWLGGFEINQQSASIPEASAAIVAVAVMIAASFFIGLGVGVLQWLVLRRQGWGGNWWPVIGAAGLTVGMVYGLGTPWGGFIAGAMVGALQWVGMRRQIAHAGWWVPVSVLAWGASIPVFLSWAGLFMSSAAVTPELVNAELIARGVSAGVLLDLALGGTLAGAIVGVPTGAAMVWLRRRPIGTTDGISNRIVGS